MGTGPSCGMLATTSGEPRPRLSSAHCSSRGRLGRGDVAASLRVPVRASSRSTACVSSSAACCLGVAVLVSVGSLVATRATFDAGEFDDPELYARGAELLQLLQVAEKGQQAAAGYESSVERSVGGFAGISRPPRGFPRPGHGFGRPRFGLARELARSRAASALVRRNADRVRRRFRPYGSADEADALVPRIDRLGSPVLAVSGNHDSSLFMRRLAAAGVIVLTERGRLGRDGRPDGDPVVEVAGFRVAGLSHPLEWRRERPDDPDRVFSFSERPNGEHEYEQAEQRAIEWFEQLPERPDLVVIHQNGLAQALARHLSERPSPRPVVILTGHDHEQHVDRYAGGVVAVDGGTVGAGGLLAAGQEYVGLAEVHFRGGPPTLRSWTSSASTRSRAPLRRNARSSLRTQPVTARRSFATTWRNSVTVATARSDRVESRSG